MVEIDKKLRDVIVYLAHNFEHTTLIRLVKLVYSSEIYFISEFGKRLTNTEFKSLHYGPMSYQVEFTAGMLVDEYLELEFETTPTGHEATFYKPISKEFEVDLSPEEKGVLDKLTDDWKFEPTKELIKFTKSTQPYLDTEKGKVIDLDDYAEEIAISKNIELIEHVEQSVREIKEGKGEIIKKEDLNAYLNSL